MPPAKKPKVRPPSRCIDVRGRAKRRDPPSWPEIIVEILILLESQESAILDLQDAVADLAAGGNGTGTATGVSEATVQALADDVEDLAGVVKQNQTHITDLYKLLSDASKKL